jgi:Lar family restriction alleviation protein
MADLKPCPFCGSTELDIDINDADNYFVYCLNCGASGRDERKLEKAKEVWNRRYEDGVTFCCECRWFEESLKKGTKGDCKLHKIKAAKNDYCAGAWRKC